MHQEQHHHVVRYKKYNRQQDVVHGQIAEVAFRKHDHHDCVHGMLRVLVAEDVCAPEALRNWHETDQDHDQNEYVIHQHTC